MNFTTFNSEKVERRFFANNLGAYSVHEYFKEIINGGVVYQILCLYSHL